jgi:hypothetical protein
VNIVNVIVRVRKGKCRKSGGTGKQRGKGE